MPSNAWLVTTVTAVLLAVCLYGYGFFQGFVSDLREACGAEGESVDDDYLRQRTDGPFPWSQPCNAGYDLVPSFVDPAMRSPSTALPLAEHPRPRPRPRCQGWSSQWSNCSGVRTSCSSTAR